MHLRHYLRAKLGYQDSRLSSSIKMVVMKVQVMVTHPSIHPTFTSQPENTRHGVQCGGSGELEQPPSSRHSAHGGGATHEGDSCHV